METNNFIREGLKTSVETESGNGALKYSTSNDDFVDNFASASTYKEPRSFSEVAEDMGLLWNQNARDCLKLTLYLRLITRKTDVTIGDDTVSLSTQRGCGLKNEGIQRMLWIGYNCPDTFYYNLPLFIAAGSWKDVFTMMGIDLQLNGWDNRKLDWTQLAKFIQAGLVNPKTSNLVKKYLPTIRSNNKAITEVQKANNVIGKYLAYKLFGANGVDKGMTYKMYRSVKTSGTAHEWQQKISQQLYKEINFDTVAGRALALLVGSKFLQNHNLVEDYTKWIESKPIAKYTGYVHELFKDFGDYGYKTLPGYKEKTINAQFKGLVEKAKENANTNSSLLVVRDISGSMSSRAVGCNMSSFCIAKAMALYFSEFLTGTFANTFATFDDGCQLHTWKGNTPCEKFRNDRTEAYASTNFQSVIDMFIKLKQKGVAESEFPHGILCISDGEFNYTHSNTQTNFQLAIKRLREAEFSNEFVDNFKIILWDVPNSYYGQDNKPKFEDFADAQNFFYMSGYDPSIVSFLFGGDKPEIKAPKTARELFEVAMQQDLLNMAEVIYF